MVLSYWRLLLTVVGHVWRAASTLHALLQRDKSQCIESCHPVSSKSKVPLGGNRPFPRRRRRQPTVGRVNKRHVSNPIQGWNISRIYFYKASNSSPPGLLWQTTSTHHGITGWGMGSLFAWSCDGHFLHSIINILRYDFTIGIASGSARQLAVRRACGLFY